MVKYLLSILHSLLHIVHDHWMAVDSVRQPYLSIGNQECWSLLASGIPKTRQWNQTKLLFVSESSDGLCGWLKTKCGSRRHEVHKELVEGFVEFDARGCSWEDYDHAESGVCHSAFKGADLKLAHATRAIFSRNVLPMHPYAHISILICVYTKLSNVHIDRQVHINSTCRYIFRNMFTCTNIAVYVFFHILDHPLHKYQGHNSGGMEGSTCHRFHVGTIGQDSE